MIMKADKGNATIILDRAKYEQEITDILNGVHTGNLQATQLLV